MFGKSKQERFSLLCRFLEMCQEKNLFIPVVRLRVFATSVKCCRRIIDCDGFRFDPANYEALNNTAQPTNGAELCQFVHATLWI